MRSVRRCSPPTLTRKIANSAPGSGRRRGTSGYATYADLLWFETAKPDLEQARRFAAAIHARYPGKPLAYNCSPSFNWSQHLDEREIADFQSALASLGYKFQFVTL